MNCTDVSDQLALLIYGDLPIAERAEVEEHLSGCLECRAERAALEQTCQALDAAELPEVAVDPLRIVQLAERRSLTRTRWQRALTWSTVALALMGLAFTKLEVQVGGGGLQVRWGQPPAAPVLSSLELAAIAERVYELQNLTRVLVADVDDRNRERQNDITLLNDRVDRLAQLTAGRLRDAERNVDALYVAQFKPTVEGARP